MNNDVWSIIYRYIHRSHMNECMDQLKHTTKLLWWFTNEYYYDNNNNAYYYVIANDTILCGGWGFKNKINITSY